MTAAVVHLLIVFPIAATPRLFCLPYNYCDMMNLFAFYVEEKSVQEISLNCKKNDAALKKIILRIKCTISLTY